MDLNDALNKFKSCVCCKLSGYYSVSQFSKSHNPSIMHRFSLMFLSPTVVSVNCLPLLSCRVPLNHLPFLIPLNTLSNQTETLYSTRHCFRFIFHLAALCIPANLIQFPSVECGCVILNAVRAAGLSVDGAAEVWRELQPLQGADGETRGAVRQLPQDRPPHGLPQWVLRPPPTTGLSMWFQVGQKGAGGSPVCGCLVSVILFRSPSSWG